MKKVIFRSLGILIVAGAAWYGYHFFKLMPQRQEHVATTKVRREDVVIRAFSRGELRAVRSVTLTAPNLFSTVQVTRLAPVGSLAREKDLVVEFDDSERRASLEESVLEVEQIDEQIKKAQADLAIRNNQDRVDLLRTRYAVRRAELEVKRNEIISAIDAKKNLLTLEEQRRRLKQLESDIKSRQAQAEAEIAVLRENRNKSMIDVDREKQRIAQAKLLSPMTGLVAVKQNRSGYFMFGQQVPDIREGDTLSPGIPVADILDLSELEVIAKVGELDRANLHEGQDVSIQLDAVPEKSFRGKIKSMSGTASSNVFSGDPAKKFDVVFSIDMRQLLSGLGVKPQDVQRIMDTAARNAKRAPVSSYSSSMLGQQGPEMAGPPMPGQQMGPPSEGSESASEGRGGRSRGERKMSDEDRKKMREAMQKVLGGKDIEKMSPEERKKAMASLRSSAAGKKGESGGQGGAGATDLSKLFSRSSVQFSEEDRAKAQLPPPPEEDSQLEVLLRPGLLADVEITVEKLPNALHVPAQAVFEKEGKSIVYVQKNGRFEERPVKLAKRSESMMILAGGVEPGEIVALADPYAKSAGKGGEKKQSGGGGGGNPMGAMGGGGSEGGGGGRKGGR
ncbi:MAG: efflux RND transporter periplasmic adaptor subunit [Acidobacteria bacterium]|nr:efflux RND transporter periplasmic adaptor subunit [Acidobacteriota bacterium]